MQKIGSVENDLSTTNPHQPYNISILENEDKTENPHMLFSGKRKDELFEEDQEEQASQNEKEDSGDKNDEETNENEENEKNKSDDDDDDNWGGGLLIPVIEWIGGIIPKLIPKGTN